LDSCGIFRDAVISIAATLANQERVRLSERTIAGLERVRASGPHRRAPKRIYGPARVAGLRASGKALGEIASEMELAKTAVARIARQSADYAARDLLTKSRGRFDRPPRPTQGRFLVRAKVSPATKRPSASSWRIRNAMPACRSSGRGCGWNAMARRQYGYTLHLKPPRTRVRD
jgi:hypothetical protein